MLETLRTNHPLRRLMAAWLQSCLGTGAGYVALLLLTVRVRSLHSGWAVVAVLLADFLPAIAFGALFGMLADRHPRRRLIVIANLLQAAAWLGLAFAHTAVPILALALLAGVGNALQRPPMRAALPVLAGEAKQSAAAWFDTCRWVGVTVGPVVAAALFAVSGTALPLALNGVSFALAAIAIATLSGIDATPEGEDSDEHGEGLRAGLAVAFSAPAIASVIICSAAAVISMGFLNVCEPLLATHVLHGSGSDYALLVAAYGTGLVTGSVLVAHRGDVGPRVIVGRYLASLVLSGLGMAGSAIVGSVAPAAISFAATGYANALLVVSETQLIQLRVPNSVQGRLFGAKDTLEGAFFLIGLIGAGALVALVGVRVTLASGAGVYAVCSIAGLATLGPLMRARMAGPTQRPEIAIAAAYGAIRRFDPAGAANGVALPEPRTGLDTSRAEAEAGVTG
ncbi:MAG TPA: MFS transporter [Solirubrobacteraceae bacterium]